jgi:hypothetical protein
MGENQILQKEENSYLKIYFPSIKIDCEKSNESGQQEINLFDPVCGTMTSTNPNPATIKTSTDLSDFIGSNSNNSSNSNNGNIPPVSSTSTTTTNNSTSSESDNNTSFGSGGKFIIIKFQFHLIIQSDENEGSFLDQKSMKTLKIFNFKDPSQIF